LESGRRKIRGDRNVDETERNNKDKKKLRRRKRLNNR